MINTQGGVYLLALKENTRQMSAGLEVADDGGKLLIFCCFCFVSVSEYVIRLCYDKSLGTSVVFYHVIEASLLP